MLPYATYAGGRWIGNGGAHAPPISDRRIQSGGVAATGNRLMRMVFGCPFGDRSRLTWTKLWRPCSDEPRYVMCECELASSRFPAPLLVCRIA